MITLGDARVDVLDGGTFRLDGGAMFHVVPRVLWEKVAPPDDRNRVELAMRPLLVRTEGHTVLVETGIGPDRRDERFAERWALRPGPSLEEQLAALGVAVEDVDRVVVTHLHLDHAGALRRKDGRPRFPRARIAVQRLELEDAAGDCAVCRASYVPEDWATLADRFDLLDGDAEVVPGVSVVRTGGHTRAHQVVRVDGGGRTLAFWGDLVPTAAHLRSHRVMSYDLYPVAVWEQKRALLEPAIEQGWLHVLYHETGCGVGRVVPTPDGKDLRLEAVQDDEPTSRRGATGAS